MTKYPKPYKGISMEGCLATWYAKNTRKDMAEFQRLAERLAKETHVGSNILEVAPGPGYLSIELAKRGPYKITGLDISKSCVEIATENARRESVRVDFQHGNASAMPFADNTFDLIICRAAFKNFTQPEAAMNEMFRTLKPGGKAIIIDLKKDASMKEINSYVDHLGIGWFDACFMKLTFRYMLIPRAYSVGQFRDMAIGSRFGKCDIETSAISLEVLLSK